MIRKREYKEKTEEQAIIIKEQAMKVKDKESKIRDQESKIRDQESKIRDRESKIRDQESKIGDQNSIIEKQETMIKVLEAKIMGFDEKKSVDHFLERIDYLSGWYEARESGLPFFESNGEVYDTETGVPFALTEAYSLDDDRHRMIDVVTGKGPK